MLSINVVLKITIDNCMVKIMAIRRDHFSLHDDLYLDV